MKYLLDTNAVIHILNGNDNVKQRFLQCKTDEVAICVITLAELLFGVEKSIKKEANLEKLNSFIKFLKIIEFGKKEASTYAKIKANLQKNGQLIGELDMQICGTAMANDLIVITNNTKEFERVVGMRLEDWTK